MAVVYMLTCVFDFIVAPILWSMFQHKTGTGISQWSPLTLQGAGLYHMAMGAILGVTAWTRGQERIRRIDSPSRRVEDYQNPERRNWG